MRRNIFEIMQEETSGAKNISRIKSLYQDYHTIHTDTGSMSHSYSLDEIIETYCFDNWKQKGLYIDFNDFTETIDLDSLEVRASQYTNELLTFIELFYNFWFLPQWRKDDIPGYISITSEYTLLKELMDDTLANFNHRIFEDAENERALVIEDKPETTAVAEIIKPELAFDVIRYNHYALKGNIAEKKSILRRFIDDLEAKRPQLSKLDSKFTSDLFDLFNNLDIRHNNTDPAGKNYNPYVADMPQEELENWYDELYQMILLSYLMLDQVERAEKVKDLREKLHSKNS